MAALSEQVARENLLGVPSDLEPDQAPVGVEVQDDRVERFDTVFGPPGR